eukprot:TRINITY_DN10667_c0_g1_i1.p1 TRINITY_DN10667_c0_g1~~TRINITY_DN10667_c0_g1_i1.p1  ORF type:complete len:204 (-),score=32.74 TRINITY_DN10667_c0_g1_i1:107-673(-)
MAAKQIKLVVVGDGAVGKTCLLLSYANNRFPDGYVPTVFDNYVVQITAGEKVIELGLWDTAGQEEYDRLRPLSYANASVFLICFSMLNKISLENVKEKWSPEVNHFCPDIPKLLIGTKSDLIKEHSKTDEIVSEETAQHFAKSIGAEQFIACSSFTGDNLKTVFDTAVKTVLVPSRRKGKLRSRCSIF